jgi:hypothetical protein
MNPRKTGCEDVDWIHLAQDKVHKNTDAMISCIIINIPIKPLYHTGGTAGRH